jgi:hypothetical protein
MTAQVTAKKSPINFSEMTTPGEKRRLARALLGSEWEKEESRIRDERARIKNVSDKSVCGQTRAVHTTDSVAMSKNAHRNSWDSRNAGESLETPQTR